MSIKKTYSEKLKDPRWQKKRLEVLERDQWCCQSCFDTENTLHVHHLTYNSGSEPWEYDNHLLMTLCADCHDFEHLEKAKSFKQLGESLYKKGFLSGHINQIASSVDDVNTKRFHPDRVSSFFSYLLCNEDVLYKLLNAVEEERTELYLSKL
jgi:hypothetical protein